MNQELIDKAEAYRMFRYEEMRSAGTYTDLKRLADQAATDYLAGYTQAEQDLSTQLTAYKEALNKCITQLKVCRDLLGHEADFIMDLTTTIVEVKFLLNPPCEDVDKKE